jgi:hypothetical protein
VGQHIRGREDGVTQNERREMMRRKAKQLVAKRRSITRAALELTIADAVRESDPHCEPLVGIIVERVVPKSPDGANWAVKGVRFGKADRELCPAAISGFVEIGQGEFEISD